MNQPTRSPMSVEQRQIAERLRALWDSRKDRLELTQVKAAAELGLTQGVLAQYLNQHIAPNTDFVLGMCRLLGVDPCDIHPRYDGLVFVRKRKRA